MSDATPAANTGSHQEATTVQIRIDFPVPVTIPREAHRQIVEAVEIICCDYEADNPGRFMWAFGFGNLMLSNPLAASDHEPLQFDPSVEHIEVAEREALPEELVRRAQRATATADRDQWLADNGEKILEVLHYGEAMLSVLRGQGATTGAINFEREEARHKAIREIASRHRALAGAVRRLVGASKNLLAINDRIANEMVRCGSDEAALQVARDGGDEFSDALAPLRAAVAAAEAR